ncbi:MAG: hypothetical protein AAGA22_00880, partial [Pseudomonadota bacterium]
PTVLLAIVALFLRRNFRRQSAFGRNILLDKASGVYTQLAHSKDEAINALREGVTIKPTVIRFPQVFVGAFSFFSLAFVANTYVEYVGNEVAEAEMRSNMPKGSIHKAPIQLGLGAFIDFDDSVPTMVGSLQFKAKDRSAISQYFFRDFVLQKDLSVVSFTEVVDAATILLENLDTAIASIGEKVVSSIGSEGMSNDEVLRAFEALIRGRISSAKSEIDLRIVLTHLSIAFAYRDNIPTEINNLSCLYRLTTQNLQSVLLELKEAPRDIKFAVVPEFGTTNRVAADFIGNAVHTLTDETWNELLPACGSDIGDRFKFNRAQLPKADDLFGGSARNWDFIPSGLYFILLPSASDVQENAESPATIVKGTYLETSMFEAVTLWNCQGYFGLKDQHDCSSVLLSETRLTDHLLRLHHLVARQILLAVGIAIDEILWSVFDHSEASLVYSKYVFDESGILYNSARLIPVLAFSAFLAAITALIGAPIVNSYLNGVLRGQAYGNDGYGERVVGVAPSIDVEDKTVGTLPARVEEEMNALSHEDAPAAIDRLRALIASGALTTGEAGHDPLAVATKFDGAELLHNGYFVSEQFAKYFAVQLVEKYGLNPSETYLTDPDIEFYRAELVSV